MGAAGVDAPGTAPAALRRAALRQTVSEAVASVRAMKIDCDSCTVRGAACTDCVVTFLTIPVGIPGRPVLPTAEHPVELVPAEEAAIGVLAVAGLVPRLRLVRAV